MTSAKPPKECPDCHGLLYSNGTCMDCSVGPVVEEPKIKRFCFYVTYLLAHPISFASIQVWTPFSEVRTFDDVEAIKLVIERYSKLDSRLLTIISWVRLPGDDDHKYEEEKPSGLKRLK